MAKLLRLVCLGQGNVLKLGIGRSQMIFFKTAPGPKTGFKHLITIYGGTEMTCSSLFYLVPSSY